MDIKDADSEAIKISDDEDNASDADKKDKPVKPEVKETKEEVDSDEDPTSSLKCDPTGDTATSNIALDKISFFYSKSLVSMHNIIFVACTNSALVVQIAICKIC